MKVAVIGLGKLGAPLLACLAACGFDVVGVDVKDVVLQQVKRGIVPVDEPGLQELWDRHKDRMFFTDSIATAVARTDAAMILVPTPSEATGEFSLSYVHQVIDKIGNALRGRDEYYLVVVVSTVMPGYCNILIDRLEHLTGKKRGEDFGFCYAPEFVQLGNVIQGMLYPKYHIVGEYDERSGDWLDAIYYQLCAEHPPIFRMNIVSAEIAKLALNAYVTQKITFANTLAEVCQQLPGADVDAITWAIGHDPRVGVAYLRGGLPYGGPCFPRDTKALAYFLDQCGVSSAIIRAVDAYNNGIIPRLMEEIGAWAKPGKTIGVLGLSYKADTPVLDASPGVAVVRWLCSQDHRPIVYDSPQAQSASMPLLPEGRVLYAASAQDCVNHAQVVVIMTRDPQWQKVEWPENITVIDPWRQLDGVNCNHVAIGRAYVEGN